MKKRILPVFLSCCLLLFTSCGSEREYPAPLPESTATLPPVNVDEPYLYEKAKLYFYLVGTDQRGELREEERDLPVSSGESFAEAAVRALTEGPRSEGLQHVIPEGLAFERVELSGEVCNIYFTGSVPEQGGPIDYALVMRAALAATVQKAQESQQGRQSRYVDVFINGLQPGYRGRPIGLLSPIEVSLDTYTNNTWQDYSVAISSTRENTGYQEHNVALYFADTTRELLLCNVGKINYSNEATGAQVIEKLMAELMKGPLEREGSEWLIPAELRLRRSQLLPIRLPVEAGEEEPGEAPPEAELPAAGEPCLAALYLEGPLGAEDAQMVYASIVYTITGFIPTVEGVLLYINDALVDASVLREGASAGISAVPQAFVRRDFMGRIGQYVPVYYPEREGRGLYRISRSMPQGMIYDPLARVQALFMGAADPGVRLDYFEPADVISVTRRGNMMVVNFRAGFQEKLEEFILASSVLPYDTRIRMFVFSLVNTLSALPGVERVWMLEDGKRMEGSLGMIYLGGPLFYNPGLILTEQGQ